MQEQKDGVQQWESDALERLLGLDRADMIRSKSSAEPFSNMSNIVYPFKFSQLVLLFGDDTQNFLSSPQDYIISPLLSSPILLLFPFNRSGTTPKMCFVMRGGLPWLWQRLRDEEDEGISQYLRERVARNQRPLDNGKQLRYCPNRRPIGMGQCAGWDSCLPLMVMLMMMPPESSFPKYNDEGWPGCFWWTLLCWHVG